MQYAMSNGNPRSRHQPLEGLEASRKVGFALFYQQRERADGLAVINHRQRERIELLLEALLELVDAVLSARNIDAFAFALRIRDLIDRFIAEEE
jgi:hypothetical protein